MSNLSGNYKISIGEVQGVDVAREQERRARLQLLDEIREPSPQPIFGEPVKVELEDETSRRIKNTLGDFTQVLANDSKSLLGIARTSSSTPGQHGVPPSSRVQQPTAKRPTNVNGTYKPSPPNIPKHPTPDKQRPMYPNPRNKPHEPPNICPPSSSLCNSVKDPSQWQNPHQILIQQVYQKKPGAPTPVSNGSSQNSPNVPFIPNYNRSNPSFCPNSVPSNKSNPFHVPNGWVSNTVSHAPRYGESSSAPPAKRNVLRPSNLKLPERKTEQPAESPIELETILREMKQAVPPPLTAIQTPRTEESGFAFPEQPKEDALLMKVKDLNITESVPQSLESPKLKDSNSCQSTSSPFSKKQDTVNGTPAIFHSVEANIQNNAGVKDPAILKCGIQSLKNDGIFDEIEVIDLNSPEEEKSIENDKCISTQLQDDLDLSESDDEPVITDVKMASAQIQKSLVTNSSINTVDAANKMDIPQVNVPSNSSDSSDSGDSDSDDSSSECDSDSSVSSEASDADTPSKMWGLRNFFDESRRNHSPAFVPMDTSTNSSTTAVREEPVILPSTQKETYSLTEDLGNQLLEEYPNNISQFLNVPVTKSIPTFMDLNPPVSLKNEILSPITSPLQPSNAPVSQPITGRGPRTPPLPPSKDEPIETKTECSSDDTYKETSIEITVPLSVPSHINKSSSMLQNSCDIREDINKMLVTKKSRISKNKVDVNSPRTETSVKQYFQEIEVSASKGLYDTSAVKDDINIGTTIKTSCPVPSETIESSHETSVKIRQKNSKSSNPKKKNQNEDSFSEFSQKGNSVLKSPKYKHPTRTCRTSTETKNSKIAKSNLKQSDQTYVFKKTINKSDSRDKNSIETKKLLSKTSLKNKSTSKTYVKLKNKIEQSLKQTNECKKGDKKKRNKFHIGNFLQSPTISQSETDQHSKLSTICSPSPNKSPVSDSKHFVDVKRKSSVSPARASQTLNKSNRSVEKVKSSEKLRRSARCSERASSIAQAETSIALQEDSDLIKKSQKRTPKQSERSWSPKSVEASQLLLTPIPLKSPVLSISYECAIPTQILVSIPLDKLSRIPIQNHAFCSESTSATKTKLQSTEERLQKKDTSQLEKSLKLSNKRPLLKDINDRTRIDSDYKNKKIKLSSDSKKLKSSKLKDNSSSKTKELSNVNTKSSLKSSLSVTENKSSKKRKREEDRQSLQKRPKIHSESKLEKIDHTFSKNESPSNQTDSSNKSKSLERCDSVSSLSSVSSLVSQKSSKMKKSSTTSSDAKREKPLISIKHIKQEKEDIIKTTIKKEPGTPEKKENCRDKIFSEESDKKLLTGPLWNDTSSQYGMLHTSWDSGPCKDDPKGTLPITQITRTFWNMNNWDFPEMNKEMKESSNKHNNPIMPMDYYYTEGRKQRHLAQTEKDPFLQTVKYFEATVLFILTSQQREEYTKEPESVYQFYRETLNFSNVIFQNVRIQLNSPGSTEFKILILLLRCQALLHVKLYNLKIKEIKEQQKNVSDFFLTNCTATVKSLSHPTPSNSRLSLTDIPPPHSPSQSPASSINSQTSGYSSSDVNGNHMRSSLSMHSQSINVTQSMLEMICRQHTHLINLHMGHDLWEQADMYMTRSNLRDFFKEVADLSENLTLHSSIKDLVNYIQAGISLVKKCSR